MTTVDIILTILSVAFVVLLPLLISTLKQKRDLTRRFRGVFDAEAEQEKVREATSQLQQQQNAVQVEIDNTESTLEELKKQVSILEDESVFLRMR